jgi:hypothetical protein
VQECNPNTDLTPMHDSTGWFVRARVSGPGDPCFGDSSWRAELMAPSTTKSGNILQGETWYYSFGVRFPAGFRRLPNSHCAAARWFGGGRPELGLGCSGANNPRLTLRFWRSAPRPRAAGPHRFGSGRAGTCS